MQAAGYAGLTVDTLNSCLSERHAPDLEREAILDRV